MIVNGPPDALQRMEQRGVTEAEVLDALVHLVATIRTQPDRKRVHGAERKHRSIDVVYSKVKDKKDRIIVVTVVPIETQ
jgi:hypothetical protein